MTKADTPQRCAHTAHLGVGANDVCNKCICNRKEVWDETFDCANVRHRVGIHKAILEVKAGMSHSAFNVLYHSSCSFDFFLMSSSCLLLSFPFFSFSFFC